MKPVNEPGQSESSADPDTEQSAAQGPGQRLRAAREQAGFTVEQVAERLHLDDAIISALELNQFESLGALVYVRGHIRKYAELLKLPAEELVSAIHNDASAPVVAEALKRSGMIPATINPVLLFGSAALLLIGLLLAVYVAIGAEQPLQLDDSAATAVIASPVAGDGSGSE